MSTTKHLEKHRLSGQNGNFFGKSKAWLFYAIPIKIPAAFSVETDKLILEFVWKCKELQIAETILKNKTNVVPNFKTYYNAAAINTMWYWHKDRHVDKQNRIESPEKRNRLLWYIDFWQRC